LTYLYILLFFLSLVLSLTHLHLIYSFVIGANFANKRLIPVGAGKAMSNSKSSPCPLVLTTVPTPHILCFALSPACQAICSAPDSRFVDILLDFLFGTSAFIPSSKVIERGCALSLRPSIYCSVISVIKRLIV